MTTSMFAHALKASAPDFVAWVKMTFTPEELARIHGGLGRHGYDAPPPLADEPYAAKVFRAYRPEVIWWLKGRYFGGLEHFTDWHCRGFSRDGMQAAALVCAIALMLDERPDLFPAVILGQPVPTPGA